MSDENGKELSLRYLPFKGKKDEWEMWSAKFMSKARKKKYLKILTGEMTVEFEDESNKTTEEKEKEKLKDEAYDDLPTNLLYLLVPSTSQVWKFLSHTYCILHTAYIHSYIHIHRL